MPCVDLVQVGVIFLSVHGGSLIRGCRPVCDPCPAANVRRALGFRHGAIVRRDMQLRKIIRGGFGEWKASATAAPISEVAPVTTTVLERFTALYLSRTTAANADWFHAFHSISP